MTRDRWLLGLAAIATVVTAIAIVAIDRPLARFIAQYQPLGLWDRGIEILEWTNGFPLWRFFSQAAVVLAMVLTLAVPRWRVHAHAAIFVAGTHLIDKYVTNHLKDLTERLRPSEWLRYERHFHHADPSLDLQTFFIGDGASFPSGHVAQFASLLIPLAVLVPRSRIACAIIIAFVMIARMAVSAHFLSDVTGGIALTALVAWAIRWGTTR